MEKAELFHKASEVDRIVSTLCDILDFEEGDDTDRDLNMLTEVAMLLRTMALKP